jgi:hypothetical protein
MASPHEKLAESIKALRALQDRGVVAVRSGDLTRTHQERLVKNGFLQEVMKGWYIPARPDEATGESTAWYASFWGFCAAYLQGRSEISDVTVLPTILSKQCKPQTTTFVKKIHSKTQ